MNAFTVDVEDWFCASNLDEAFPRQDWPRLEGRVEANTCRLLALLQKRGALATFFVLGWVAERYPSLIREILASGHEIASHGYSHRKADVLTREAFESDIRRSLDILESIASAKVIGYRAPSFCLTPAHEEIFDALLKNGIKYDSSLYPQSLNPSYGRFNGPDGVFTMKNGLIEVGLNSFKVARFRIPFSGGAYFRIYPYALTKACIAAIHKKGIPYVFYVHPWEIDPGQPAVRLPRLKRFRHYHHLAGNEAKVERLLSDFEFTSVRDILGL